MPNSSVNNSETRHVSLFVPELLSGTQFLTDIPKAEIPKLPATQLLLSRASQKPDQQWDCFDDLYQGVCVLSGVTISKLNSGQQDLPIAAITVAVDKEITCESSTDYFMFAEPVVMQADRDTVVLLESLRPTESENSLSFDECKELIAEINHHFADEPWQLDMTEKGDWYLILNSRTAITTTTLSTVLLKNAQEFMPKGTDAQYWRKIINEIEMLLFASKVNEKRIENNKPSVVSLWLWGGGQIPAVINSDTSSCVLCGDIDFLKSLSQFITAPFISIKTQSINDLLLTDFNHLILVNTALKVCWQRRDLYAWIDTIKEIETNLMKPLLTSLHHGDIDSLSIYQEDNISFTITRRLAKSWWKRVKSFDSFSSLL